MVRKLESLWLDRAACAALLDITTKHFDEFVRPSLPADACKGDRRRLRFWAGDVVAAWVASRVRSLEERLKETVAASENPDAWLAAGGDSPGLERGRLAKAELLEIDLAERKKRLIEVKQLEAGLIAMAEVLRRRGEKLTKRFGNDAGRMLSDAVEEWESAMARMLNEIAGEENALDGVAAAAALPADGAGGAASAAADDAAVRQ